MSYVRILNWPSKGGMLQSVFIYKPINPRMAYFSFSHVNVLVLEKQKHELNYIIKHFIILKSVLHYLFHQGIIN